jgi:hypothetical protein
MSFARAYFVSLPDYFKSPLVKQNPLNSCSGYLPDSTLGHFLPWVSVLPLVDGSVPWPTISQLVESSVCLWSTCWHNGSSCYWKLYKVTTCFAERFSTEANIAVIQEGDATSHVASSYSIFCCPSGYPTAAYTFFSSSRPLYFPSVTCFRGWSIFPREISLCD